ncbi:NUDIX hydrolase [Phytomonospora sp. NPDC050363]|uniref:NUDIX hydrolase n=1 Tax=Phytomonospora sp. NPDC050363 TaxID=3155642 RepID=UPI00340D5983
MTATPRTYTHPDILTTGVAEGWAEPVTDPTIIDWTARQARALIPFEVIDGRPVNPIEPHHPIQRGRNECGHWGESVAADAIVTSVDAGGCRWILMIERDDGYGWAVPGGHVDDGEDPADAVVRELREETGLVLPEAVWTVGEARYVPDPRASREAWKVTVPAVTVLDHLPEVEGADDAARAAWVHADDYATLTESLAALYGGQVFAAHRAMLAAALDTTEVTR